MSLRLWFPACAPCVAALLCACAAAPVRNDRDVEELKAQVTAQSALIAQQQRRLEELEVRLTALASRSAIGPVAPAAAPAPQPAKADPRPSLQTVKLAPKSRRSARRDRNPVEHAPRLPSSIQLVEPDAGALASLEEPVRSQVDEQIRREAGADHAFAEAVQKLNAGDHAQAELELLTFAARYPRHTAADNAIYLAGLVRSVHGDCAAALPLFERVPARYPAGDAVVPALLERGRCLAKLQRRSEAREALGHLEAEYPDAPEATVARQLLQDL